MWSRISKLWQDKGKKEDGHVPGIKKVPEMGPQDKVLDFAQRRIQETVTVK